MPATQAKNQFASILEEVIQGRQVVITKHKAPKAVVISVEKYKALTEAATPSLNALTAEFDARLARMQTAAARAAMQTAFNASSDDLGRAAQQAARRRS
jgi:prevent-host-death family protein